MSANPFCYVPALAAATLLGFAAFSRAAPGDIATVAGNGTAGFSGDSALATGAQLNAPFDVTLDAAGNFFIADQVNHRVRKVAAATGLISTVAGNGTAGFSGDGGSATLAMLNSLTGVAVDAAGNLFIADAFNNRIRKVDPATGVISTVAGNGTAAVLNNPTAVAPDGAGNLFIADSSNHRIRRLDATTGALTTFAGTGIAGYNGDNGPAAAARLNSPFSLAFDAAGNLFIADTGNHVVRRVDAANRFITTVVGTGVAGYTGDTGPATAANLNSPMKVAVDAAGSLFIGDRVNNVVRRVDGATGLITTIAGTGAGGFGGDNGPAVAALLNFPQGVSVDTAGNLFIADHLNNRIRRVFRAAAPVTYQPDNLIGFRRARFFLFGDGRYNRSGAGQLVTPRLANNRKFVFFVTAENDAAVGNATGADSLRLRATRGDRNFRISFRQLAPARRNVTAKLTLGSLLLPSLQPGGGAEFKARVKPTARVRGRNKTKTFRIKSVSVADRSARDTVRAVIRKKR